MMNTFYNWKFKNAFMVLVGLTILLIANSLVGIKTDSTDPQVQIAGAGMFIGLSILPIIATTIAYLVTLKQERSKAKIEISFTWLVCCFITLLIFGLGK